MTALSKDWLRSIGYTISGAARACGVSANHVSLVLRGERKSEKLQEKLAALPPKMLVLREKIKVRGNLTR